MTRYLIRLKNDQYYNPKDSQSLARKIRELLGARETIGNLRVSRNAIEFDLFAKDKAELDDRVRTVEKNVSKSITIKELDKAPLQKSKDEILQEGVRLFNEERYWESHEVLEQVWQPASGPERDVVHGVIMVATALVHYQKARDAVSLDMLRRALEKLKALDRYDAIDLSSLRRDVESILTDENPRPLRIRVA